MEDQHDAAARPRALGDEGRPKTGRAERIRAALDARFRPSLLRVADDSANHAGHAGAQPGGQTHYTVTIVAADFAGQGRVARHRAVNDALAAEFAGGLHALSVRAHAPGEADSQK